MQDVIVASLFLEEVAVDMGVLFIRVDSDEATFALILCSHIGAFIGSASTLRLKSIGLNSDEI